MNHMPLKPIAAPTRAPTRRALAKQRTREKILASARELFTEKGYERATIRDIASTAGMSTGAVFASFSDKSELFQEILTADHETVFGAMRDAAVGDTIDDKIIGLFAKGYEHHMHDMPLLQAAIAAAWSPEIGAEIRSRINRPSVPALLAEILAAAQQRGEVSRDANVSLMAQMFWDSYLANYRHAAFEGWGLDALTARLKEQVGIILAGARKT